MFSLVFTVLACLSSSAQQAFRFPAPVASGTGVTTSTVSVPIPSAGTIAQVKVVAQGLDSADFVAGTASATCTAGASFSAGATCSIDVTFQPKGVGEHRGAVVLIDTNGAVMGQLPLYGRSTGGIAVMLPATIGTVVGSGDFTYKGNEGIPAKTAPLFLPYGIALDPAGNLYLSDSGNHRIRKVDAQSQTIQTIAGTGSAGTAGDGLSALQAQVNSPGALLLDGAGDLYIADSGNHAIRKLVLATGKLITIAGHLGVQGSAGDNGPANQAYLNTPEGLAMDAAGNLYIADTGNSVVRKIDAATGNITTFAGTITVAGFSGDGQAATSATLNTPWGLTTDTNGNLYIADPNSARIRKVSSAGIITTLAVQQPLKDPSAILVDAAGNFYIADSGHNQVLKMSATTGQITVAAGNGSIGTVVDGIPAPGSTIYGPYALALDGKGNLFISDLLHNLIREVYNSRSDLHFDPIRVGRTSLAKMQNLENDGNAPLQWSTFDPDQNATFDPAQSTCAQNSALNVNATCTIAVQFMPQITGSTVAGKLEMNSDAVNTAAYIGLTGESDALEPTTTTLNSTPNPSAFSETVTFTASVKGDGSPSPSGTIKFFDGNVQIGSASTVSGTAVFTYSTLALGSHSITAAFTGDATNEPSSSGPVNQIVKQRPVVTLVSSANPTKVGQSTTLTATVTASPSQPTGTILFKEGNNTLGTVAVNGSGVATLPLSSLPAGGHTIIASYQGDSNNLPVDSAPVNQQVNLWSTTTTLGSSVSPTNIGEPTTFTITVVPTGTAVPTGTVTIFDGNSALQTVSLDSQGMATFPTPDLGVGTHVMTAKYTGDSTNDVSTSVALSQVVQKISTTTLLATSANPAKAGANLHLMATVTASTTNTIAGPLNGTVAFTEGATVLGTGSLDANGKVSVDVNTLDVGPHTIVATYVGNASYATSASSSFSQQVELATTTVQLSSNDSTSIAGNKVTFTAAVAGDGGIPSGQVTFFDGAKQIGQGTLDSLGHVSISLSDLVSGSHTITAQYAGDAKDKPATSTPFTQVVQQANTSITLASNGSPSIAGTNVIFSSAISSSGGSVPTGQLQLMEGTTVLSTGTISTSGTVQFTLNSLSAGSHTLVAAFAGDVDHAQATSTPVVQVIRLGDTALKVASSANPSTFGSPVNFTATLTGEGNQPTGSVVFLDGTTPIGTGTLNASGVASVSISTLVLGAHTITVNYAGDATHNPSAPAALTQSVQQATTTTLTSGLNPSLVGNNVVLTAAVQGAINQNISGTVDFFDAGSPIGTANVTNGTAAITISTFTAGSHILVAKFSGDAGSKPSDSAPLTQTVNTADTTVTVTSSSSPAMVGTSILFTATVVSKGETPKGTVTFLDGTAVLGTAQVTNGAASLSVNTLNAGQHAIVARYGGDGATQVSASNVFLQVVQQNTKTVLVSDVNPALTAQALTLTATITGTNPSGSVTFMDGSTFLGTAVVTNGTANLPVVSLSAGTHTLTAIYAGDNYNLASTSAGYTQSVQMRPSTTSMTTSSQNYMPGEQVTLVAVVHTNGPVSPGGTVTFTSNGQSLGTVNVTSSGAATLVLSATAQQYDVVAAYSGDGVYLPSTADKYTITLAAPGTTFVLTTNPSTLSLTSGEHQKITVTASSSTSFTDTLSLGCLDLPAYATCTFSVNTLKLGAGGAVSADVEFDTGLPLGAGPRAPGQSAIAFPAAVLLGLLLLLNRRRLQGRRLAALLSVAVLMLTGLSITGCGTSMAVSSTPAGTYTLRVIATGNGTGLTRVANVAVTVK
ncbi:MAG: Ig-like domain repeat protein [Acidobacteria bacterium]|nr:Ig-like domain repeat protein [Acidobacteriota bacterium]